MGLLEILLAALALIVIVAAMTHVFGRITV